MANHLYRVFNGQVLPKKKFPLFVKPKNFLWQESNNFLKIICVIF